MANHAPQAIIPSFGHIVCPVSVSQSGIEDIPQDRWKSLCPLLQTGCETPSMYVSAKYCSSKRPSSGAIDFSQWSRQRHRFRFYLLPFILYICRSTFGMLMCSCHVCCQTAGHQHNNAQLIVKLVDHFVAVEHVR